jgi:hypothetical protein
LLRARMRDGAQPRSRASRQDESLHRVPIAFAVSACVASHTPWPSGMVSGPSPREPAAAPSTLRSRRLSW